jgi:hypothetical protein
LSPFRCSAASAARDEPVYGTASTVRPFLLVECPGPWGTVALRDCRLPVEVKSWLQRAARTLGVRTLLIRRHRPRKHPGLTAVAAYAHPSSPWMETADLDDPAQLLDLDLGALSRGASMGLTPSTTPVFAVCTHGKHDACCAEQGRPIARVLSEVEPEATWEVSHIGGDRFAGNVLVLHEGLYYGRLDAASAVAMAAGHRASRLDLDHLRGRSGYPMAVQAAEVLLRRELDLPGLTDLRLLARGAADGQLEVDFRVLEERTWRVRISPGRAAPERLTCCATADSRAPRFELSSVEPLA